MGDFSPTYRVCTTTAETDVRARRVCSRADAILERQLVFSAQQTGLDVLHGERLAATRIVQKTVGTDDRRAALNVRQTKLQFAIRIRVKTGQLHVLTIDQIRRVLVVLAEKCVAKLETAANWNVIDTKTQTGRIPIVGVDHVDVVAVIVDPPDPDTRGVRARNIGQFHVRLRHADEAAAVGSEGRRPVQRVVQVDHTDCGHLHAVAELVEFLIQLQLAIDIAFVAEPIFAVGAGQLEALLRVTFAGAGSDAQVAVKLCPRRIQQRRRKGRRRRGGCARISVGWIAASRAPLGGLFAPACTRVSCGDRGIGTARCGDDADGRVR